MSKFTSIEIEYKRLYADMNNQFDLINKKIVEYDNKDINSSISYDNNKNDHKYKELLIKYEQLDKKINKKFEKVKN